MYCFTPTQYKPQAISLWMFIIAVLIFFLSGHKFGAPLGIGVLYINSSVHKRPLIVGGGQEREMHGGTENVPGIVGIGRAAEIVTDRLTVNKQLWGYYRSTFLIELGKNMYGVQDQRRHAELCLEHY